MTEEAKTCFEILKKAARFGVANCQLCPAYPVCPIGTAGWNNECMLETAADLIETLSEQLEQVTRERDALQVEIDVLNEEYYAGIHTIRPAVDAEPVRHGYWIPQDNTHTKFMCSDCKGRNHDGSGKYCSECGCKMDAEAKG